MKHGSSLTACTSTIYSININGQVEYYAYDNNNNKLLFSKKFNRYSRHAKKQYTIKRCNEYSLKSTQTP